jgi:hypothetical protein
VATIKETRLLLIRAGIIILIFCAVAGLWSASKSVLPENVVGGAIWGGIAAMLFYLAWQFSMRLGKQGRFLKRSPGDKRFLSSSLLDQLKNKPTSAQGIGQHKDSVSPEELETDSSLAAVNDQLLVRLAQDLKSGQHDRGLWIKALAMADGNKSLRKRTAIYFRLRAERLQKEAEQQRARLELKRLRPYKILAKRQKAKARSLRRQAVAKRVRTLRSTRRNVFALVFSYLIIATLILIIYGAISHSPANLDPMYMPSRKLELARILGFSITDVLVFLGICAFVSILSTIIFSLMDRDTN